jgi:L-2-hydroxyglutarate oxidase LhgO
MTYTFDVVVVGAGVVGLACARQFALSGYDTLLLESETSFGKGISSRNSEVIHAGIYYRSNSLKAELCVRGRQLLYEYCESRRVAHRKIGKWIIAQTAEQSEKLHQLHQTGLKNGCTDLYLLDQREIRETEPSLRATEVLCSPSTGIIDSHGFMQSMASELSEAGGIAVYQSPCGLVTQTRMGFEIRLEDPEKTVLHSPRLVNACGLDAVTFARQIAGLPSQSVPPACYAKGNYFSYNGKVPFQRLIYPVPETGGLGIHLTLDLNSQARFGPDVEWISQIDYQVNETAKVKFAQAIQRYWPECEPDKLQPGYAGIRPKIGTQDNFLDDFLIQNETDHGIVGLVNLFGIESPGLTASMAIAEHVFSILTQEKL